MVGLVEDFLGEVSERSVRDNHLMIYDLVGEMIECGQIVETSSEFLKYFIQQDVKSKPVDSLSDLQSSVFGSLKIFGESKENLSESVLHASKLHKVSFDFSETLSVFASTHSCHHMTLTGRLEAKVMTQPIPEISAILVYSLVDDFQMDEMFRFGQNVKTWKASKENNWIQKKMSFKNSGNQTSLLMKYSCVLSESFKLPILLNTSSKIFSDYLEILIFVNRQTSNIAKLIEIHIPIPPHCSLSRELIPNENTSHSKERTFWKEEKREVVWKIQDFQESKSSLLKLHLKCEKPEFIKSILGDVHCECLFLSSFISMDLKSIKVEGSLSKWKRFSSLLMIDLEIG